MQVLLVHQPRERDVHETVVTHVHIAVGVSQTLCLDEQVPPADTVRSVIGEIEVRKNAQQRQDGDTAG